MLSAYSAVQHNSFDMKKPLTLPQKLALAVVIKLAVLTVIWWVWIRGQHVNVDPDVMRAHVSGAELSKEK